ncbi:5' exonuclease Apollo [Lamellibrachia satsuma]|nr:5' exonuclease Apollo [Lamellibrachia satsuma]
MNGHLIPNTPIAVDFWKIRETKPRIFFLTHMHADHTVGLTSTWRYPIYCSPVSKRLLLHKFSIDARFIHALEENESHIVPLDERGQETMTVTVINANHCPGAVMYLFDGDFGRILYTGDFRYEPYMSIHTVLAGVTNVDVLYLDNTYNCNACNFPTRSVAKTMVCDIIRSHPHDDVVIGVRNLGKEDLLEYIAEKLQTWIAVTPAYYNTLSVLQRCNVFTTDMRATFIRAVPMHLVKRTTLRQWNKNRPTIAILPTGLFFAEGSVRSTDLFVVPYSDHSSYSELEAFVEHVKPRLVVPIVREMSRTESFKLNGITDMSRFSRHLDTTASPTYQVPATQLRGTAVTRQPSIRRRDCRMTKRRVQRLKKKMGYEFTDVSPVKGDQNSLSGSNHNLQQSHDQSYDRVKLMNQPLQKRKLPLSSVMDYRKKVKTCEEKTSDHMSAHQYPRNVYGCRNKRLPASLCNLLLKRHSVSNACDQTDTVSDIGDQINEDLLSPAQSSVTDKSVDFDDQINDKLQSPAQSSVTDKSVDFGDQIYNELQSLAQISVTDKSVDIGDQINKELLSPAQSSVTDKSVDIVNDIGDQINEELLSPAQSSVTDKSVDIVNDIGDQINEELLSPAQSSVTDKSVDIVNGIGDQINEQLLSPAQSSVTDKSVDIGDQINKEPLSPAQSSVTDKSVDIVNDIGDQINEQLLSPAQSSVTDKSVDIGDQINEELLSPAQSSVTNKSADIGDHVNDELSAAECSLTDKSVDTVSDVIGDQINNELSLAQSSLMDKRVDTISDISDQINNDLLSPTQSSLTDKSVDTVNNIDKDAHLSPAERCFTDINVDIVSDTGDHDKDETLSPAERCFTDINVDIVSDTGDHDKDEPLSPAQRCLPDDVSDNDAHNIDELCQFLCSSRTVPPAAKENTGKVTESFQLKVTRFHFRQVARSATNVRHCGGSRHVKQKKVCASTQEEVNIQQYGSTRSVARTQCPVEVKVQDSSRAHLQEESGGSTGTSAATSICHVRPVIPDCVAVPPRQTLQNSLESKSSQ